MAVWDECLDKSLDPQGIATLRCIPVAFGHLVSWAFVFAGVVALFFLIWGGIRLIFSGGDKAGVEEGKKTITYAVIGLIVVLISFLIVNLVAYVTGAQCITVFGFDSCSTATNASGQFGQ